MATDEERREVVSFLRNNCVLDDYAQTLGDIAGYEYPIDTFDAAGYLADLIDRPTCRNTSGYRDVFLCSECGVKLELIAGTGNGHGDVFHVPFQPIYCPNCGAEVVDE